MSARPERRLSDEALMYGYGIPDSSNPYDLPPVNLEANARRNLLWRYIVRAPHERREKYNSWYLGIALMRSTVKQVVAEGRRAKILDIGCYDGEFPRLMHGVFGDAVEITAVDVNEHFLTHAEQLTRTSKKHAKARISYEPGRATRLSYPEEYYDIVTEFFVSYHVEREAAGSAQAAANQAAAVTRTGGINLFASRDVGHQGKIWNLVGDAAEDPRIAVPRPVSFYTACDISATEEAMRNVPGMQVERARRQYRTYFVPLKKEDEKRDLEGGANSLWTTIRDPITKEVRQPALFARVIGELIDPLVEAGKGFEDLAIQGVIRAKKTAPS